MDNRFAIFVDDDGQPYLAHHGIRGQKWGVRRFQNSDGSLTDAGKKRYSTETASKATRSLNQIERENANLTSKSAMAKVKAEKAFQKGNDEKYNKYKSKAKEYDDAIEAGKKVSKKLISEANNKGYTVDSVTRSRYTHVGRLTVATYLGGIPGALTIGAIDSYRSKKYGNEVGGFVEGKQYKVTRSH